MRMTNRIWCDQFECTVSMHAAIERMDVSNRAMDIHAATSATLADSPACEIIQSVACCALDAAVNMALESAFSTFNHELMY